MTTETKRDSLPILKDRVSLSPELMTYFFYIIIPANFIFGVAFAVSIQTLAGFIIVKGIYESYNTPNK